MSTRLRAAPALPTRLSAAQLAAPTNETSRDELLRRDEQMRQEIAMLQTKLQEIEKAGPKDDLDAALCEALAP